MKKIILSLCLAGTMVLAGSCSMKEFLDVKPRGKELATKIDHFIGELNHNSIHVFSGNFVYANLGEELTNYPSPMERLMTQQKEPGVLSFTYDNAPFAGEYNSLEWDGYYAKIYQYNTIIAGVMDAEDGTELQKKQIQAEARFQRAYLHFCAAIMYTKPYNAATAATDLSVPVVTKADTQGSEGYVRATAKELYDWVIAEMKEALPLLPDGYGLTRCYSAPANVLLGRVYWYLGDYQNALTYLNAGYQKIHADSRYKFLSYRTSDKTWKGVKAFYNTYPDPWNNSEMVLVNYISLTDLVNETSPMLFIKQEYVDKYADGDLRINHLTKHAATGGMRPAGRKNFNLMVELPELYFMLAECEARAGSETKARELMSEYRISRFADDASAAIPASVVSKDDLIKFIVEERILEYPARGASVIDMKRLWNDPLFQFKKKNFTHTVIGGDTYTMDESAQLTWKIPYMVKKFHSDWKDN